eukprot:4623348-Prymnesium_polylepis.1
MRPARRDGGRVESAPGARRPVFFEHEGHRPAHDSWLPQGAPASVSVVKHSGRAKSPVDLLK